jgi:Mn-dependent DtxR family transcriptional regulator
MDERTVLTPAHEDYIEAIVELEESQECTEIRSVDIANLLEVSKASVNKALQTLRDAGYIVQERYGRITLTEPGRAYGKEIWHRHQALRGFLVDELGVDPEVADEEACEMEHAVSSETMALWAAWLERLHAEREVAAGE